MCSLKIKSSVNIENKKEWIVHLLQESPSMLEDKFHALMVATWAAPASLVLYTSYTMPLFPAGWAPGPLTAVLSLKYGIVFPGPGASVHTLFSASSAWSLWQFFEIMIKNLTNKSPRPVLSNFRDNTYPFQTLKLQREEYSQIHSTKPPKPDKGITQKRKLQVNITDEHRCKSP